jgi:hypothetical protein
VSYDTKNDAGYCADCGRRLSRYEEMRWQNDGSTPDRANCFECKPEEMTLIPESQSKEQGAA